MKDYVERLLNWNSNNVKENISINDYLKYINRYLSHETNKRFKPLYASICITEKCNFNCHHCYERHSNKSMTLDNIKQILDELNKNGIIQVTITGGETLLHPDIIEIVQLIKKYKFSLILQTNGTLIDNNIAKSLNKYLDNRIDFIQISLEGSKAEIHNKQGRKGFEEIINNIKLLVQNYINVVINITPTKNNEADIFNTFKLGNQLNVYGFKASPLAYLGKGNIKLDANQYKLVEQEGLILSYNNPNTKYLGGISGEIFHWASIPYFRKQLCKHNLSSVNSIRNFVCDGGRTKLHINVDGTVFPCVFAQNNDLAMGNLLRSSFYEIWFKNYKNIKYFKQNRDLKETKCEKCEFENICKGGCVGIAYEKYKNINVPDPRCKCIEER